MKTEFLKTNKIGFALLFTGILCHYLMPGRLLLIGNLCLLLAVLAHSIATWGVKRTIAYTLIVTITSYSAEWLGVHTGHIFGTYYYNSSSSRFILDGVPFAIPLMYVYLAYSGQFLLLAINRHFLNKDYSLIAFSIMAGSLMMLRDLATDPIRSTINKEWIWTQQGYYFGVPIQNFIGWFGVFFILTLLTTSLVWHCKNYSQTLRLSAPHFYLPIAIFLTIITWGITSGISAYDKNPAIAATGIFISCTLLLPQILLGIYNILKQP